MNCAQGATNAASVVYRIIDFADVRGQFALQFAHPRRRSGRDDNLEVRQPRLQRAYQLRANPDLADTDGMHPQRMAVRDRLFELGVIFAEALAKTFLPIAAPPHSHEIIRRRQRKKDRKQDVVEGTHYLLRRPNH